MTCGSITILRTTRTRDGERFATKRWRWNATLNQWISIAYDAGARFLFEERAVANLEDVAAVINVVRRDPRAFIVRGVPTEAVRAEMAERPGLTYRRRKIDKAGVPATLAEAPLRWVMFDIDGWLLPAWADLAGDPEAVIDVAIYDLLPECFHDAICFWQLSASAGFKVGILKAHLFFWLAEPIGNAEIRAYMKVHAPLVDRAPFQAAQPHYIADPIIEGGHDPLPRRIGWRQGSDDAVVLPAIDLAALQAQVAAQRTRTLEGAGLSGIAANTVEAALALLGDTQGHEGWHHPLRRATMLYALQTPVRQRDTDALKQICRAGIRAAVEREAGMHAAADIERFCSDFYLNALIEGAFRLADNINHDAPEGVRPFHDAPGHDASPARARLQELIDDFLTKSEVWHATPQSERGEPRHLGLAIDVGGGKSTIGRECVAGFSYRQREECRPSRVFWGVPTIALGRDAEKHFVELAGVRVAIHRGREQDDPLVLGKKMCLDLPSVASALAGGESVDKAVCGSSEGRCPFFGECGYQRQRQAVDAADIIIGAHELIFRPTKGITNNLGLVVLDEAWWQDGIQTERFITLDGLAADPLAEPVFRMDHKPQVVDDEATNDLHTIRAKVERALKNHPEGYVTRTALVDAGLTAENCGLAGKLEWQRKREGLQRPGMSAQDRKKALEMAGVNAQLPRFAAFWTILQDLLGSQDEATGRAELQRREGKDGAQWVVALNTRREVSEAINGLPILLLDATLPAELVKPYLPDLEVAKPVRIRAPHMEVHQVVGGFGKTSLFSYSRQQALVGAESGQEEQRESAADRGKRKRVTELRDFVAGISRGQIGWDGGVGTLVVTYKAIKAQFANLRGVETAHFNAVAGHDRWRKVRNLFVIGYPQPKATDVRKIAAALTGRAINLASPAKQSRGLRMKDGILRAIEVRVYEDPTAEAVRAAIADNQVVQAIGRARGINRTSADPVRVWLLAAVATPLELAELHRWADLAPSQVERMACRGVIFTSPSDASKAYPDVFETPKAAEHALHRAGLNRESISPPFPYDYLFEGEWGGNTPVKVSYRPQGRGQQTRVAWARLDRLNGLREELEAVLGPLVLFNLDGTPEVSNPPPPPNQASAAQEPVSAWEAVLHRSAPSSDSEIDGGR